MGLVLWYVRMSLLPLALLDPLINQTARLATNLLSGKLKWSDDLPLWTDSRQVITHFIQEFSLNPWRILNFSPPEFPPSTLLFTDASLFGGAAVADNVVIWQNTWDFPCDHRDILYLECLAWSAGVSQLLSSGTKSITAVVDNETLYHAVIKTRCNQFRVSRIICKTLLKVASAGGFLRMGWISTERNIADKASRGIQTDLLMPNLEDIRLSETAPAAASYIPGCPGIFS